MPHIARLDEQAMLLGVEDCRLEDHKSCQASDLGGIANQLAAIYRARVNVNLQALATQHYGSTEPPLMYPNMLWFDSGTDTVKLRDPTNTAWGIVGSIGPPMKRTNVDLPSTAFTTGDVSRPSRPSPTPAGC